MVINLDFNSFSLDALKGQLLKHNGPSWLNTFCSFLEAYSNEKEFLVQTSGTTGTKKEILVSKKQMQTSAKATLKYFNLQPGNTVFLNLSCDFIAGKMMLVRAIEGKLNCFISEPTSDPSNLINQDYDFAPFVPLQIKNLLNTQKAKHIKQVLVGGGKVEEGIIKSLKNANIKAFESFGMTETLSHFALKEISPEYKPWFEVLDGFEISQTNEGNLCINKNPITNQSVFTNDIVVLKNDKQFIWKGRSDNLINSGGVKLIPEEIEQKISKHISIPFVLIGMSDEILGEKIVLVVESNNKTDLKLINSSLSKFEKIKDCFCLENFPKTLSGKIIRQDIIKILSA